MKQSLILTLFLFAAMNVIAQTWMVVRKDGKVIRYPADEISYVTLTEAEMYPTMLYEKTENKITLYKRIDGTNHFFAIPIVYRYAAYSEGAYPSYRDNWGVARPFFATYANDIMSNTLILFQAGEAELAINVESNNDSIPYAYVGGGAHGFENVVSSDGNRQVRIMVDGKQIGESDIVSLTPCESFDMYQRAELVQAWTNSNPWAIATKHWHWDLDNDFCITSQVEIVRALKIKQAQFGMFCVYRHSLGKTSNPYLTHRALKDNDPQTIWETDDGWESDPSTKPLRTKDPDCKKITEWGELGFSFSMAVSEATLKENGGLYVRTNGSGYNKIYFDLTGAYTPQVGEVLKATQTWSFSYTEDNNNSD